MVITVDPELKDDLFPGVTEGLLRTLVDMDPVAWYFDRLVIAPKMPSDSELRTNLAAGVIASAHRFDSIDYVRRRYVGQHAQSEDGEYRLCVQVFRLCEDYLQQVKSNFMPSPETRMGVFAASVALDRMRYSFSAVHILYSLGLNFEGDSVSRHILEQVAWSVSASSMDDENKLAKLKSHHMGELKKIAPQAGVLYGYLSKNVHAGIDQHRQDFSVDSQGRGRISFFRNRLLSSYSILADLTELWVVAFEWTQRDYLSAFTVLDPEDDYSYSTNSEFMGEVMALLDQLSDHKH
ncbi:hypothetical protein DEQ16_14150 [Dietzia maris]|nr:hypothetical protein DEQ16_14150 [Dietzia maris]